MVLRTAKSQLPPTSAGSGGGRGVVGVGTVVLGAAVVGTVVGTAVVGTVVLGTAVVGTVVVGAVVVVKPGRWKSSIVSSRITRSPALMTNALDVTMYSIPSLSAVKAPSEDREAEVMSLAPSRTRTPRYWYSPPELRQIATREVFVLPKTTAVAGEVHRAVEST